MAEAGPCSASGSHLKDLLEPLAESLLCELLSGDRQINIYPDVAALFRYSDNAPPMQPSSNDHA